MVSRPRKLKGANEIGWIIQGEGALSNIVNLLFLLANSPYVHRVENVSDINVSMTVSYTSPAIRRGEVVSLANGLLRHRFGVTPRSRALSGAGYWGKAVLQKALRDSQWVKRERGARRGIEFRLDKSRPGEIMELVGA